MLRDREAAWHRFRVIAEEREHTRVEYGPFFAEVQAIITRHDPIGIIFDDVPHAAETEYQAEAGTITPRLRGARTFDDVQWIVDEEFDRWFWTGVNSDSHRRAHFRDIASGNLGMHGITSFHNSGDDMA